MTGAGVAERSLTSQPIDTDATGRVATRYLGAGIIAASLFTAGGAVANTFFVATIVLVWLTLDRANPLSMRNVFLGYMVVIFGLGAFLLGIPGEELFPDVFWYTTLFLSGYYARPSSQERFARAYTGPIRGLSIQRIRAALALAAVVNLLLVALDILRFGVIGFYRGQALAAQLVTYGQASLGGGATQILTFLVKFSTLGLTVAYVQACFESGRRVQYRYPAAILVGIPLVALRRSDVVAGAITLLAIAGLERRVMGRSKPVKVKNSRLRTLFPLFVLALGLGAAAVIGRLREQSVGSPRISTATLLTSELTPVQAYSDIKVNISKLGHPRGTTIIGPLLLKPIPRAWYPNKPMNSGAYYMSKVRPAEFAAGYALPTTFFGDAFLNFGYLGALLAAALLGLAACRLDSGYTGPQLSRMPLYLIAFANFYAVLRNPISESVSGLLLTLGAYAVIRRSLSPPIR